MLCAGTLQALIPNPLEGLACLSGEVSGVRTLTLHAEHLGPLSWEPCSKPLPS